MTIKEKLILESNKQNNEIILHREGIFYIAYEHSAWLFSVALHCFKVKKVYVKCVAQEVVSIGFPMVSLDKLATGCEMTDEGGVMRLLVPACKQPQNNEFEQWKDMQQCAVPKEQQVAGNDDSSLLESKLDLLEKINVFPIECKTPVECMLFLIDIKNSYKALL